MSLITRILPPNDKGFRLTFSEMDNNLYYLQSLGVSGFSFSSNTLTITNPTGGTKSVVINQLTGLTINGVLTVNGISITGDTYITGGTINKNNDTLTLNSNNIAPIVITGFTDYYTTGGTYNNNTKLITFLRNDNSSGYTVDLSTIDTNDTYVTGGTNNSATFDNPNSTIDLLYNQDVSPGVYSLPYTNVFLTGITYDNNTFTLKDNSGNTFNQIIDTFTGLTVDGLLSATTLSVNGISITGDTFITGGTYVKSANTITLFSNNIIPIVITGITTDDYYTTAFTYNNNTFTIKDNSGNTFNANINTVTGLTSTGTIKSSVISATTYQNLPLDIYTTGGTFNKNTSTLTLANNTGGTFNVTGFTDITVTGGTFNKNTSTLTLANNTGGTFNVTGITDYYVTGGTFSTDTLTLNLNGLPNVTITGLTNAIGALTGSTIDLRAAQPITVTGGATAGLSATFAPIYVWANQGAGGGGTATNFWNFVVPINFSSGGKILVDTIRNFNSVVATSRLNVYVDGVISNISSANIFPTAINSWETISNTLTTPITAGQTITVTIVTTFGANGQTTFFRDLYFNYTT